MTFQEYLLTNRRVAGGPAAVRVHLPRRARPHRARRHQPRQRARRVLRGPGADGPHAQHLQVIIMTNLSLSATSDRKNRSRVTYV